MPIEAAQGVEHPTRERPRPEPLPSAEGQIIETGSDDEVKVLIGDYEIRIMDCETQIRLAEQALQVLRPQLAAAEAVRNERATAKRFET